MEFLYPITTMSFAWPWLLMAPPLIFALLYLNRKSGRAASLPSLSELHSLPLGYKLFFRKVLLPPIGAFFIIFLSIAAARPQRVNVLRSEIEARSLMLAVDVSPSMGATDFKTSRGQTSRLNAVKIVVNDFVAKRQDDLLGLVVFAGRTFLENPLTSDHDLVESTVNNLEVGMAGDGTAIGDGLGLALKRLEKVPGIGKAVILLTDGVSNAGAINPLKAARVARDLKIKVYTIGIGSTKPVDVHIPRNMFRGPGTARAEYDEETLQEIARLTAGVYRNAESLEGLQAIYQEIDRLEKHKAESQNERTAEELFPSYAILAFACLAAYALLSHTVLLKLP